MQQQDGISPLFVNTDKALEKLEGNESTYIKDMAWDVNGNPNLGIATGNPTGEGQNLLKLTPMRSNAPISGVMMPGGFNKNVGEFYSETTQEFYYFNYNANAQHGIYIINGDTLLWQKIIIDPELNFPDDPEAFIANHRVSLRAVYDENKNIRYKYLIWTNGQNWQGYIDVTAALATDGFNASIFPYWALQPPHFDRRELLEFAPRPMMYAPKVTPLQNDPAEVGTVNRLIDKSFQFAYANQNTDGISPKTLSPRSLPLIIKSEDFLNNPDSLPKRGTLTLYAGSPKTERLLIYVRLCGGDWRLYDTIDKFKSCDANDPAIIENSYWLRTNQWEGYNYNSNLNQIEYEFDYSKVAKIISQPDALRLQNDMPLRSVAQGELGDAIAFGYNQYGYPNFSCEVTENLDGEVVEKESGRCDIPARSIRLYAYIGRCGDAFNYDPQVGYYLGEDKQMRFGGVVMSDNDKVDVFSNESKTFDLTFGDKDALICYLKGTPYYSVGKWFVVNQDNTLEEVQGKIDLSSDDGRTFVQNVFISQGYFICVFDLTVPAGKYIATLGRHNVNLSGNWRDTSTYIVGLANSRIKSTSPNPPGRTLTSLKLVPPSNCLVSNSKEMEIDCTSANVDVWGNGQDTFYVYCPYVTDQGNKKFRFIEGYLLETPDNPVPVELFPYRLDELTDNSGAYTDKNGFYFAYTKAADADDADTVFTVKLNCAYPFNFTVVTSQGGSGWRPNPNNFVSNFNGGNIGDCNRIIYRGKISNLDGTIGYSNISVSIKDGATVITRQDGTFEMIVHNGFNTLRVSNVYVNAAGNYLITLANCGYIPLTQFNEGLVNCISCTQRVYPIELLLAINIETGGQTSTKEGGKYIEGIVGADLAGRMMFVNPFKELEVPTFLQRNNTNATYLQALIAAGFNLSQYPDMKWVAFYVSKNLNLSRYLQWVGDKIQYIDNRGNVVDSPTGASLVAITIDSLYNANISQNFSTLANYQFVKGDRLRILDNGDGQLLNTATYGDPIDVQILGTNYNQAAINAGLLTPNENTLLTTQTQELNTSITLIVRYDSRLDTLIDKNGFWIEIYTPATETEALTYCEVEGFYPVINGRIAEFTGYSAGVPTYNFPSAIPLNYWDTYLLARSITIPDIGNKFFNHFFESPNISDTWGAGCTSCGRQWVENKEAAQLWYKDDVIKGDDFVSEGLVNGLATFRSENRKNFKGYNWGGIIAIIQQRSIIAFICENDWFCTNYNFQYVFANAQGVQVANLDDKLSDPIQKIGGNYGLALEHTRTLVVTDNHVTWYDYKNEAWVDFRYQGANDISKNGMQSFFNAKTTFITKWNVEHDKKDHFEVFGGIDRDRNNLYLTFRPRRNNTNNLSSYINNRRNWQLAHQETIVYNLDTEKFVRAVGFTPEGYGNLKGKSSGLEMITFAAGKPYKHFGTPNTSFLNYYGQTVEPVVTCVLNKEPDIVKLLQSISLDATMAWFADLICTNEINSYSYLPLNYFKKKENVFYAEVLRDMNSYPDPSADLFRSGLLDGKAMRGLFVICRLVGNPNEPNTYRELKNLFYLMTQIGNTKK